VDEVWASGSPGGGAALEADDAWQNAGGRQKVGNEIHLVELGMDRKLRPATNVPAAGFFRLNLENR
jgi:hypothetical protein